MSEVCNYNHSRHFCRTVNLSRRFRAKFVTLCTNTEFHLQFEGFHIDCDTPSLLEVILQPKWEVLNAKLLYLQQE